MFHVTVFNNSDSTEQEFTFDNECVSNSFVRGLQTMESLMITYHQSVVLPSGRTFYTELSLN